MDITHYRWCRPISLAVVSALFYTSCAAGVNALAVGIVQGAQNIKFGRPGHYTQAPTKVYKGTNPKRDPIGRAGWWTPRLLADRRAARMKDQLEQGQYGEVQASLAPAFIGQSAAEPPSGGTTPGEGSLPVGGGDSGGTGGGVPTPPVPVGGQLNSNTGNFATPLSIVRWPDRGDNGVSLYLTHNSMGSYQFDLGKGWSHSYDVRISYTAGSSAIVRYGTGLEVPYTCVLMAFPSVYAFMPPTGVHDQLTLNGNGTWTITTKNRWQLGFNSAGYLTTVKDRSDNTITISRNSCNKITAVTDTNNRQISFGYNSSGLISTVTDPKNRVWTFTYNTSNQMTGVTYPALSGTSYTRHYTYNTSDNILTETDLRNKVWSFAYDGAERLTSFTNPLNNTWTYAYGTNSVTLTNPLGGTIVQNYSNGLISSIVDEAGYSMSATYDADKNLTQVIDQRGKVWQYTYDALGNTLTTRNPLNQVTSYTYNYTSDLLTVTNGLNEVTTYVRNAVGKPISVTDPLNVTVESNTYDSYGQLLSTADALGNSTSVTYDNYGNVITTTDSDGMSSTLSYDIVGLKNGGTDATGLITSVTKDDWGRVTSISVGGSQLGAYTYGPEGHILSTADDLNRISTITYDDIGLPTATTNAMNETEYYTYNAVGWKTSVTNGRGYTRTYTYTPRGEEASLVLPDNSTESWSYDGAGNLTSYTNPLSQTILYSYNDAGDNITIDYPSGVDSVFTYDALRRVTSMQDSSGTTIWTFDAAGQLTNLTAPQGSIEYTYNSAGLRTSMVEAGVGTTSYTYDNRGRLQSMTNPHNESTLLMYDSFGRLARKNLANGAYELYFYDSRSRVTSIVVKNSSNIEIDRKEYVFDDADRLTQSLESGVTTYYSYDALEQLVSESKPSINYLATYSYDANGNRLSRTVNGAAELYAYDNADKLLTAGSKTYGYDAAGRTTSVTSGGVTTTLTYDYENRIVSISKPGMTTNTFTYNGLDTRISKVDSLGSRMYKRDGAYVTDPVLSDGTTRYTPGVSERKAGISTFQHAGLKNALAQSTGGQSIIASRQYDAFGNITVETGSWSGPFGYGGTYGYQEDQDTGLKLLGHRYYDASTGRFLTRDPEQDGRNWYTYAENNPLANSDPEGLKAVGHHVVPQAIWKDGQVSSEAAAVFDSATTGEVPGGHNYGDGHADYNKAVREELEKYCKERNIDPKKMTAKEARDFINRVLRSKDARIAGFLKRVYDKFERKVPKAASKIGKKVAKKASKKIAKKIAVKVVKCVVKKIPLVGWVFVGYDVVTGGPVYAFNELVWPLSELWGGGGD